MAAALPSSYGCMDASSTRAASHLWQLILETVFAFVMYPPPPLALTHHLILPSFFPFPSFRYYINNIYKYTMPVDLLHPSAELEARTHKLKRLVQSPNSFFMDIKCPGCFQITTVFSHAQSVVLCGSCNVMLCQPTGGRARLTEGCSYRKKVD
jgi:small subunit ribosomal protein S27e